jgi:hypothetical protein
MRLSLLRQTFFGWSGLLRPDFPPPHHARSLSGQDGVCQRGSSKPEPVLLESLNVAAREFNALNTQFDAVASMELGGQQSLGPWAFRGCS